MAVVMAVATAIHVATAIDRSAITKKSQRKLAFFFVAIHRAWFAVASLAGHRTEQNQH
jgi:hypothetical protein